MTLMALGARDGAAASRPTQHSVRLNGALPLLPWKQQRRFLWSDWFAAPTLSSKWAVTSSCARTRAHVGVG